MGKNKRLRIGIAVLIGTLLWVSAFVIGHSKYLSDSLSGLIAQRGSEYLGQDVSIEGVSVNPIPFFLELTGVVVRDGDEPWFRAERVKIYINLLAALKRKVRIQRLYVSGADLHLTANRISLLGARGPQKASGGRGEVGLVDVRDAHVVFESNDLSVECSGLWFTGDFSTRPSMSFRVPDAAVRFQKVSLEGLSAKGRMSFNESALVFDSLRVIAGKSFCEVKGRYGRETGEIISELRLRIDMRDVARVSGQEDPREGMISSRGTVAYSARGVEAALDVSGKIFMETLLRGFQLNIPVRGLTEFRGTVRAAEGEITAAADTELTDGHIYGIDVDKASFRSEYDGKALKFIDGTASALGGSAQVAVSLRMPHVEEFMVDVKVNGASSERILRLIDLDLPLRPGVVTGSLHTEGSSFRPHGSFLAHFKPREGDVLSRIRKAEGNYEKSRAGYELRDVVAVTDESRLVLNGAVDAETGAMSLRGTVNTGDLGEVLSPFVEGVSGYGYCAFQLSGTRGAPSVSANVHIENAGYRGYEVQRVDGRLGYSDGMIEVKKLTFSSHEEKHELTGIVRLGRAGAKYDMKRSSLELGIKMQGAEIASVLRILSLPYPVSGLAAADLEIRGTLDDPQGEGSVRISNVSIYGYEIDSVESRIGLKARQFLFRNITAVKGDSLVSADLSIDLDGSYEFKTRRAVVRSWDIPSNGWLPRGGRIEIDAEGQGTIADPSINARVRLSDFQIAGEPLGDIEVTAALRDRQVIASGSLFGGRAAVNASALLEEKYPWRLEVALGRGIYDFVLPYLIAEMPEDAMLDLEGKIELWGDRDQFSGTMNLNAMTIGMYGYTFSNSVPVRVAVVQNSIRIEQFELRSGTATFDMSGSLVPRKSFDLTVHGDAFLTPIRRFFKSIETVKGTGSFVFSIRGEWTDPEINGGIVLEDCSLGIKDFSYRLYDVKSYIYVDSNTIVMESFSGKVGGGDVSMTGFGYFTGLNIERFYVDMYLSDVTFRLSRGFLVGVNGNIVYHGEKDKHSLVGQVNLVRVRYTDRFDLRSQILKAKRPAKQKGSISRFDATELNIKIDGKDDVTISNNIAKTSLKVDLLLRGTVARPLLFGRVETEKGSIYFRNNEFDIIRGSMDFIGEEKINPYFDVTATTSVKGYNIRITVEGQLDQFNLTLVSDPPLDDTDILALLTMGQLGSSDKGIEGGVGTAEATSFLSAAYQDVIEERLTSITGFDRFQVEPYLSEDTGTVAPRLIVSKRLIGDKLYLTYASSVGTGESDIIKIEYQVDRHVSLIGSQDDRGSLGGDIKFRFEFK